LTWFAGRWRNHQLKRAEKPHSKFTPRSARAALNRLLSTRTVSPDGAAWLIVATDPFHDTETTCNGFPDVSSSKSLIQCVTKTASVSAPVGVAGNWRCDIFNLPMSPNATRGSLFGNDVSYPNFWPIQVDNNAVQIAPVISASLPLVPGINVISSADSQLDWTTVANARSTTFSQLGIGNVSPNAFSQVSPLVPDLQFFDGIHRLIAIGFEVVNTTADLYRQGSVTSYRTPSFNQTSGIVVTNTGGTAFDAFTECVALPPGSPQLASLIPNSRTWEAREGCYVVCTLNRTDNPYHRAMLSRAGGTACSSDLLSEINSASTDVVWIPPYSAPQCSATIAGSFTYPWDISGSIFSGLSNQTTLQVTARYYFEKIPEPTNPALLVLARPPSDYDPVVMQIYARVMNELPVAVMAKDNPLGEWFTDILRGVADWAPKVGNALSFLPGASAIGDALGTGAKTLNSWIGTESKTISPPPPPQGKRKVLVTRPTNARRGRGRGQQAKGRNPKAQ